jgi:CyaY protein
MGVGHGSKDDPSRVPVNLEQQMNDSEFNELVDETFDLIENALESMDLDLDFDQAQGVLTIECSDQSKLIFSRQIATHEIWITAKSGGYHLVLIDDTWISSKTGEALGGLLSRLLTEQSGRSIRMKMNDPLFGEN